MADQTHPDSDRPGNLPDRHQEVPTPDPHRGDPVPPANQGARPEADPSVVRPDEEEPVGPLEGLVSASGAKAKEEATPGGDPEAEALLAQMGVEEEGIESGQLLGLMAATVAAVIALAVVLILLFYEPFLGDVEAQAEDVEQYPELRAVRVDAAAKLDHYGRADSVYTIPIEQAMGIVAAEYGGAGTAADAAGPYAAMPASRADQNTFMVVRGEGGAVEGAPASGSSEAFPAVTPPATGEEVGVDEPEETIPDEG